MNSKSSTGVILFALVLLAPLPSQGKTDNEHILSLLDDLSKSEAAAREAARRLVEIGRPVVRHVTARLNKSGTRKKGRYLEVLEAIGPGASESLDDLVLLAPKVWKVSREDLVRLLRAVQAIAPYEHAPYEKEGMDVARDRQAHLIVLSSAAERAMTDAAPSMRVAIANAMVRTQARLFLTVNLSTDALVESLRCDPSDTSMGWEPAYVRELAAELLGYRGARAEAAIPSLKRALLTGHPKLKNVTKVYFGEPPYADGSQSFEQVSYDRNIYEKVARAMIAIAPSAPATSLAYAHLLRFGGEEERERCVRAFGLMGRDGVEAVSWLMSDLANQETEVVRDAITALGMIGPAAEDAIPALRKLTDHDDRQIRERAEAALRQITAK